jgi:hypothetical protein
MGKNTKVDFTGQDIYVGIDTGKKSWKVSILTNELAHKTFSQPPIPEVLVQYLILLANSCSPRFHSLKS